MSASSSKRRPPHGGDDTPQTPSEPPPAVAPSIEQLEPPSGPSVNAPIPAGIFRVPERPRSASAGESHPAKAPKVAIPRLKKDTEGSPTDGGRSGGRHRVTHACEPCRQRKTKCSGERPVCKHCQDFKIACYYADGKRDRVKKQFGTMAEKLADYEALLKDLSARVSKDDAELIFKALDKEALKDSDSLPDGLPASALIVEDAEYEPSGGESEVSGGAGSTGALDRIEEDFARNEESRATGFMGKNSEITWMQRLRMENKLGSPERFGDEPEFKKRSGGASSLFDQRLNPGPEPSLSDVYKEYTVSESSYHLDDFSVSVPDQVDPYELPPKETAESLFNAYLNTVHPSFPLIGKGTFSSQFRRFFNGPQMNPGPKWLAILNLIFAVSSRYSHLVLAPWRGDERDHLIYFARARLLSMNGETLFAHADLQQVQIWGLSSFYLVATNQINRAWTIGGMSIRAAISLGLNMRNESTRTPDSSKEIRYRVWWSLYILEQQLSMMTGRPSSILDHVCTTPLPVPFEEDAFSTQQATHLLSVEMQKTTRYPASRSESVSNPNSTPTSERSGSGSKPTPLSRTPSNPNSNDISSWAKDTTPNLSLYFLYYVELTRVGQDVLDQLYTPEAMTTTWSYVQGTISQLSERLDGWLGGIPTIFDFTRKQRDQSFLQQRITLGFYYYGTRIILNRPCLCRLDRKIPRESNKSKDFNRQCAANCIDAARDMLELIPDQPNAIGLNKLSPWWCILHFLVQATVVLMLELSFRANHMPEQAESILGASKKGVRWLYQMSEQSLSASRAWKLCDGLLRDASLKVGGNADDMPTQLPQRERPPTSIGPAIQMNPAIDLSFVPTSMSRFPALQGQMNVPFYTGYDQFQLPPGMLTQPEDYFPTGAEMEFLSDEFHNEGQSGHGMGPPATSGPAS